MTHYRMTYPSPDICAQLLSLRIAINDLTREPRCDARLVQALLRLMEEISLPPSTLSPAQFRSISQAIEVARSLAAFLASLGAHTPTEEDLIQINTLLGNLMSLLCPDYPDQDTDRTAPLVTPIAPSGKNPYQQVALYLESRTVTLHLQKVLESAGFEPYRIASMAEIRDADPGKQPVAIVADLSLCREDKHTREVMQHLRTHITPAPHLFCLALDGDFQARLEAVRLGATRFLKKPLDTDKLLAVLRGVTDRIPHEPFRILLVDDDRASTLFTADTLAEIKMEVRAINDPTEALTVAASFRPDVIVMDMYMPGCNGLELASILRQDEELADTPILFLSAETSLQRQSLAMDLGGDDFLTKPVMPELLQASVLAKAKRARMLRRTRQEHRQMASRLHSLLGHAAHPTPRQIWRLDLVHRLLVAPNGTSLSLSAPEMALLRHMAASPEHGASREELIATLTGAPNPSDGTRLEALISRLRKKSASQCGLKLPIRSEYGHGYSFVGRLQILEDKSR